MLRWLAQRPDFQRSQQARALGGEMAHFCNFCQVEHSANSCFQKARAERQQRRAEFLGGPTLIALEGRIGTLQAQVERLRSALKKYGRHVDMPGALNRARCLGGMSCVCGLEEALAADSES